MCVLQVSRESIFNKMNSSNLACVFGLNLIWPSQGASSLSALVPLNLFTELLIEYYEKVFSTPEARGELGTGVPEAGERGGPFAEGRTGFRPSTGPASPPAPLRPLPAAGTLRWGGKRHTEVCVCCPVLCKLAVQLLVDSQGSASWPFCIVLGLWAEIR